MAESGDGESGTHLLLLSGELELRGDLVGREHGVGIQRRHLESQSKEVTIEDGGREARAPARILDSSSARSLPRIVNGFTPPFPRARKSEQLSLFPSSPISLESHPQSCPLHQLLTRASRTCSRRRFLSSTPLTPPTPCCKKPTTSLRDLTPTSSPTHLLSSSLSLTPFPNPTFVRPGKSCSKRPKLRTGRDITRVARPSGHSTLACGEFGGA